MHTYKVDVLSSLYLYNCLFFFIIKMDNMLMNFHWHNFMMSFFAKFDIYIFIEIIVTISFLANGIYLRH